MKIYDFLDTYSRPGMSPADELHSIYKLFMDEACTRYNTAMSGDAAAAFPSFSDPLSTQPWITRLAGNIRVAQNEAARDRLMGELQQSAASPPPPSWTAAPAVFAPPAPFVPAAPVSAGAPPWAAPAASVTFSPGTKRGLSPPPSAGAVKPGRPALGSNSSWVMHKDASTMQIRFPDYNNATNNKWHVLEWRVPECMKFLKDTEGSDKMCLECAVCKKPYLRYSPCTLCNQSGHAREKGLAPGRTRPEPLTSAENAAPGFASHQERLGGQRF